jgi:hypothetical protein
LYLSFNSVKDQDFPWKKRSSDTLREQVREVILENVYLRNEEGIIPTMSPTQFIPPRRQGEFTYFIPVNMHRSF